MRGYLELELDDPWWVPNPPFANPGVAEKAPWRSLQGGVAGVARKALSATPGLASLSVRSPQEISIKLQPPPACYKSLSGSSGPKCPGGTLWGHFLDTLEAGARRAPETPQGTLLGHFGPRRARETPVAGRGGCKHKRKRDARRLHVSNMRKRKLAGHQLDGQPGAGLSAPNHKSQIASDLKSRSPNRKNFPQIAVSGGSNRTFKSRDL